MVGSQIFIMQVIYPYLLITLVKPEEAKVAYGNFVNLVSKSYEATKVKNGEFGAEMLVSYDMIMIIYV